MKLGIHGLPLRSAVVARRRRRLRILATASGLCLLAFVAFVAMEAWPQRARVMTDVSAVFTPPSLAMTPAPASASARPVYRHSIVPGGAYTRAEVAHAIRKDAVVAAHYQDVDVDKVAAKTVDAARAVYVSYRLGNQVYWTKKPVRLAPGETVLTDGDTEIRARCGNLVSDHAQQPVAADEPPLGALDEEEPETGASTIAGARGAEGALTHVPFFNGGQGASGLAVDGLDPASDAVPGFDAPMFTAGGAGASPFVAASTGLGGTSLAAPRSGERPNNPSGGGPGGGGSNGDGPKGDGPSGGGPGEGGPGGNPGGNPGGGNPPAPFVPPTTTGEATTTTGSATTTTGDFITTGDATTGSAVTTTTGNPIGETTGGDDPDGEIPAVPEPGALVLLGLGACGLAARALRARRR